MATVQAPLESAPTSNGNESIPIKQPILAPEKEQAFSATLNFKSADAGKGVTEFQFTPPSKSLTSPALGDSPLAGHSGGIGVGWDLRLHSTTSGSDYAFSSAIQPRIANVPVPAIPVVPAAAPPLQRVSEKPEPKARPAAKQAGCLSCIQRPSVKEEIDPGLCTDCNASTLILLQELQ